MIKTVELSLLTPRDFNFSSTLSSYGWVVLAPNQYLKEDNSFSRVEPLPGGQVARLTVSSTNQQEPETMIDIHVESPGKLGAKDKAHIERITRRMLRLDEDYTEFHALCAARGGAWAGVTGGKGRMLRSPALFEDLVKVICTTNIQWGGTKRMVRELVDAYGQPYEADPSMKTFPTPEAIAADPLEAFRSRVNLGYRAAYLHELAVGIAEGKLSLDDLADASAPTAEIRKRLIAIKGVGGYAAASMLMLLGRYDELPMDTVFRDFVSRRYFAGGPVDTKEAAVIYTDWGRWKALAYWFEMLESD